MRLPPLRSLPYSVPEAEEVRVYASGGWTLVCVSMTTGPLGSAAAGPAARRPGAINARVSRTERSVGRDGMRASEDGENHTVARRRRVGQEATSLPLGQ